MKLQKSELETETKTSAQQKKFQRLSKNIEQEKRRLEAWRIAETEVQARVSNQLAPAYAQLREVIFQQIEQLLKQKKQKMTQGQRLKVDEKIQTLSVRLLGSQQMSAVQVAFLNDLLGGYDPEFDAACFAADAAASAQKAKENDPHKPEDVIEKFAEKTEQQLEQEFLDQCTAQEQKSHERKVAAEKAKQAKKQQQREQAKKIANQSVKSVYFKIAALIHPDREQDEQKKQHKTELLQQVNHAYAANDLLNLLAVQIELGLQQDAPFAQQQLKAYNLVLEEQLDQLNIEIDAVIYSFQWNGDIRAAHRQLKVQDLYSKYEQDWSLVQHKIEQAKRTLDCYKDAQTLKTLMRSQHIWEIC